KAKRPLCVSRRRGRDFAQADTWRPPAGHSAFCLENSMVTARPILDRIAKSCPTVNPLSEFGRFISDRTEWIADRWNKTSEGQPELAFSGNTTYRQLANYLP